MSQRSRGGALLALLVTASVLSTGVVGVALADTTSTTDAQQTADPATGVDGEAVIENFTERLGTLETVEFTRTVETETDDRTASTTTRVVADLDPGRMRTETIDTAYGANTTTVVNETHVVTYNPEENTVNTIEHESQGSRVVPQLAQMANESAVEYEYVGTDTVDGEDVYLLDAVPQRTPEDRNVSVTVAVDTETYFPVRYQTSVQGGQYGFTFTQTYSNVTINGDVPESAFELDVPENATEPSFSPNVTSYDDHGALRSAAELSVPAAELPGGFEFDSARIFDGDSFYSVSLTYTNNDDRVQVSVQAESSFDWSEQDDHETVQLGDETGYYSEHDEYALLHSSADGQSYSVYGKLDKNEIVDIGTAVVDS